MNGQPSTPSKKRKTIDDFFSSTPSTQPQKHPRITQPQTPSHTLSIPGLSLIPNFINALEETTLLDFLSTQPWRTDLSRRVIHYGGTYCLLPPRTATPSERHTISTTILRAPPVPASLTFLITRMIAHNLYPPTSPPSHCIVNEYRDDQGISAHVENFRFISPVCGLTLGCGDNMRFHELTRPDDGSVRSGKAARAERTGRKVDVWMPPRSLLVMAGDARERWQHEIVRGGKGRVGSEWRRVSLTFRAERMEMG